MARVFIFNQNFAFPEGQRGSAEAHTIAVMEFELASMDEDGNMVLNPELLVRGYEKKFFRDVKPVTSVTVLDGGDSPGFYDPETDTLHINRAFLPFRKSCCIVLLHELVHHKLFKQDGDADPSEGDRFNAEIGRLWREKAYVGLL
jgi:hypothetical protein